MPGLLGSIGRQGESACTHSKKTLVMSAHLLTDLSFGWLCYSSEIIGSLVELGHGKTMLAGGGATDMDSAGQRQGLSSSFDTDAFSCKASEP